MDFHLQPAFNLTLPDLAALLTEGYSGYFVPISFTPEVLVKGLRIHGIDLHTSRVIYHNNDPVGLTLLAQRGWTARIAAMAILPNHRSAGLGQKALEQILYERREQGDRVFTLEVIEENYSAIRIYEKAGFTHQRRLVGYWSDSPKGESSTAIEEVDIRQVANVVTEVGLPDLPWQISGETLAQYGPPYCGFRLRDAFAVIAPHEPDIEILSVVTLPKSRRQGAASRLLQALFAKYPYRRWKLPARFPEEVTAPFFEKLGFVQDTIRQKQMFLS